MGMSIGFYFNLSNIFKLFSGESTEEELLRRLQQIKEGPPPQNSDENRGIFGLGEWVEDGVDKELHNCKCWPKIIHKWHKLICC